MSGFNVYPVEVEEVSREVEGVAEAAVIGVAGPRTGEAVVAYVSAARRRRTPPTSVETPSGSTARSRLARFKQPTEVHVVDELPHTVTGKVAKGRLRAERRRRNARAPRMTSAHGSRSTPSPAATCATTPGPSSSRSAPSSGSPTTRSTSPTAPDSAELMEAYGEEIPVTFVDGRQHDFWRVDADRLRAALA